MVDVSAATGCIAMRRSDPPAPANKACPTWSADPPLLAEPSGGDGQAGRTQVFAEQAGRELAVQPLGPPRGVLVRIHVDGAVLSAVTAVDLLVAGQPERSDVDRPAHRSLVDRRAMEVPLAQLVHDVDGPDRGLAHRSSLPPARRDDLTDVAAC